MGERVRFQALAMLHNEIKELEYRAQRPIRSSLVAWLKALISRHRPLTRDVVSRRPIRPAEPPDLTARDVSS
jgi:hypothetical protein